jgi:hypothetical protein
MYSVSKLSDCRIYSVSVPIARGRVGGRVDAERLGLAWWEGVSARYGTSRVSGDFTGKWSVEGLRWRATLHQLRYLMLRHACTYMYTGIYWGNVMYIICVYMYTCSLLLKMIPDLIAISFLRPPLPSITVHLSL